MKNTIFYISESFPGNRSNLKLEDRCNLLKPEVKAIILYQHKLFVDFFLVLFLKNSRNNSSFFNQVEIDPFHSQQNRFGTLSREKLTRSMASAYAHFDQIASCCIFICRNLQGSKGFLLNIYIKNMDFKRFSLLTKRCFQ